jgi:exopolysaccharide biosynthesis predicted pyruvyltransferase EpsI
MPVEPEKMDALTRLLEHLPSRKKIVLTIPQTHPHNLTTINRSPHIFFINFPHKTQAFIRINFLLKTNTTSNPSHEYSAHVNTTLTSDFIARTPNW